MFGYHINRSDSLCWNIYISRNEFMQEVFHYKNLLSIEQLKFCSITMNNENKFIRQIF
jgi:hypothetical protein